jgi:hypothetical protein
VLLLLILIPRIYAAAEIKNNTIDNLLQRLHRLEPEKPVDLQDFLEFNEKY